MAGRMSLYRLDEENPIKYTDALGKVTNFISPKAFAKKHNVSISTVYKWIGNNQLTNRLENGGRYFIPENAEKPTSRL